MKNCLQILIIALSCLYASCNNKTGQTATTQKNLDAMHGVSNAFDSKDFSKLGDYIAVDAVDHSGESGDIKGLDSMKVVFARWADDVIEPKTETIKELADDDYVMSWLRFSGTYKTDGMGHKAGDRFDMKALEVSKCKDGKMVEHWTLMEPAEVMKMMPAGQAMPMSADSTKKKN